MPVIATNTAANTALRYLNLNSSTESSSVAKLSSGSRITKASDDAAGLAVGVRLQSDVTVLQQASTNASHGMSVLQTADGGAARISDILQRMKTLASQSLSGAVTDDERAYINSEFTQLISEIGSIASGTRFNGESLLDGTTAFSTGVDFLLGTDAATDSLTVTIADIDATALAVNASTVDTQANAETAATAVDAAIDTLLAARASIGAQMSRFDYRGQMIETSIENLSSAQSAIMDADVAEEQSNLTTAEVLTDASISALSHANDMATRLSKLLQ
ncbi:flagellin [Dongia sp.]|uniref:flagellin n=1 Tax=Dongia sp. TaxID=1977262 RepID=UPI0035AF1D39